MGEGIGDFICGRGQSSNFNFIADIPNFSQILRQPNFLRNRLCAENKGQFRRMQAMSRHFRLISSVFIDIVYKYFIILSINLVI